MKEGNEYDALVYGVLFCAAMFAVYFLYCKFRFQVNFGLIILNDILLYPFTFFSDKASEVYEVLTANTENYGLFTFNEIIDVYEFTGKYLRFVFAPLFIGLSFWVLLSGVSERYKTTNTMENLIEFNSRIFPCMKPVIRRNLLKEPLDTGAWKTARQPIQWMVEKKLLINTKTNKPIAEKYILNPETKLYRENSPVLSKKINLVIDFERLEKELEKQIEPTFKGFDKSPEYIQGLISAFILFGFGEKKKSQQIFDAMNNTFVEPLTETKTGFHKKFPFYGKYEKTTSFYIENGNAKEIWQKYKDKEAVVDIINKHGAYTKPLLMGLLDFARKKGVLSTCEFIWLRPTDRGLWYALNQLGGRTAWIEGVAAWEHYYAEEKMEKAIFVPIVKKAITAVEVSMYENGWINELKYGKDPFAIEEG